MPILILGGGDERVAASASFQFKAAPSVMAEASFITFRSVGTATASASFTTNLTAEEVSKRLLGTSEGGAQVGAHLAEIEIAGMRGGVLSWEYSLEGTNEDLNVKVAGLHGLVMPRGASIYVYRIDTTTDEKHVMWQRSFSQMGQEPRQDAGGDYTEFRFRNSPDRDLRGIRLPELIPWKQGPSAPVSECGRTIRQRASVSQIVKQVIGKDFSLADEDLLAGSFWVEGLQDYSTEGKSPQAVWDETYGALGMELRIIPNGAGSGYQLVGSWSIGKSSVSPDAAEHFLPSLTLALSGSREWLQTPTSLTLKGEKEVQEYEGSEIAGLLGGHPAAAEVSREFMDSDWGQEVRASWTVLTGNGISKRKGMIVAELNYTVDDVPTQETVDGKVITRLFSGVLTSMSRTSTDYDPTCPGRPLRQKTRQYNWVYTPFTEPEGFALPGPYSYAEYPAGEVGNKVEAITTFHYSEQGFLTRKTTETTRLASLQQEKPTDAPEKRGKIKARETLRDSVVEDWSPIPRGMWRRVVQSSVQALVPLYDAETGEAIRTEVVTRMLPPQVEYVNQAPPSYDCRKCDRRKVQIALETGTTLRVGDAGHAEPLEINLPLVPRAALSVVAKELLLQRWGRIKTSVTLAIPYHCAVGTPLPQGTVRSVRIGQAEGEELITTTIEAVGIDSMFPFTYTEEPYVYTADQGQGVVLANTPGGALVRVANGWGANGAQQSTEKVNFKTGFPPRAGDVVDWRTRDDGIKEAVRAR